MSPRQFVALTMEQRAACAGILGDHRAPPVTRRRAAILIHAASDHRGRPPTDDQIAERTCANARTVARVRASFARHGFHSALYGVPKRLSPGKRKLTRDQEAMLLELLDSPPPPHYPRWSYRTLAEHFNRIDGVPCVSRELVRRTLERHNRSIPTSYPLRMRNPAVAGSQVL